MGRYKNGPPPRALLRAAPAGGVTLVALVASAALLACAAHSASAQEWHAGAGLSAGDSFTYSVCEKDCYEVSLDFVAELASGGRSAWVVQARVSGGGQHILLLDSDTMDLRPAAYDFGLSGSLSRTLLYISEFAPPHRPKGLEPGTAWGHVPGSPVQGTQLAVMSRDMVEAGGARHEAALLQYTVFETSTVAVWPDFPFPVSALLHGLEGLAAAGGSNWERAFALAAGRDSRRGVVAAISDFYCEPEDFGRALRLLGTRGHDLIVFHLLSAAERQPRLKAGRNTTLRDAETGRLLEVDAHEVRRAYPRRLAELN